MQNRAFLHIFYCTVVLCAMSCTSARQVRQSPVSISGLKYISTYDIPFNLLYNQTVVGGLSGIDYDAKNNFYYLISDDRSDRNPARFYTAKLFFTHKGIDSLVFTGVEYLRQPGGTTFPNSKEDRFKTPDPEAIRYNPKTGQLTWSSEGERIVRTSDTVLTDPAVFIMNRKGKCIDEFVLPGNLKMQASENGPRRNGTLEGMSFADDYKTLFVSAEEPLYNDGSPAGLTEKSAFIRIFKFDVAGRKCIAQYAYQLEPVAHAANPPTAFSINGVSEILNLGNNKLLVMEWSFSTGRLPCTIKLFIADLNGATDISAVSLKNNTSFIPAKKTLLLNLDDLDIYTDNLEGFTFGPVLPNGNRTLICIADNNFNILEKAQLLLFEVLE